MTWTPERTALLMEMRARGATTPEMMAALQITRGQVAGKLSRMEGREVGKHRHRARRPVDNAHVRGDWEYRLTEPYAAFKARKQMERENGLR